MVIYSWVVISQNFTWLSHSRKPSVIKLYYTRSWGFISVICFKRTGIYCIILPHSKAQTKKVCYAKQAFNVLISNRFKKVTEFKAWKQYFINLRIEDFFKTVINVLICKTSVQNRLRKFISRKDIFKTVNVVMGTGK